MTVVIAGALDKRGFIMTDTRVKYSRGGNLFEKYDECKKIHYSEEKKLFNCGYGVTEVDEQYNRIIENSAINIIDDFNKCYYEALNKVKREKKYPEGHVESSVLTQMWLGGSVEYPKIEVGFLLLDTDVNKVVCLRSDDCLVWFPADYDDERGRYESLPFQNGDFFSTLLKSVERFIQISEKSDDVSHICSLAYMDYDNRKISYFEEDMQVMKSFLYTRNLPPDKMEELALYQYKMSRHNSILDVIK